MKYKILYLVIVGAAVVAVLGAVLSAVWNGFLIIFGLALLTGAISFTIVQYSKHKDLKEKIYQKRYVDAYMYADEHGEKFDVAHFKYPKKEEREVRQLLRDSFVWAIASLLLSLFCLFVLIFICSKVF